MVVLFLSRGWLPGRLPSLSPLSPPFLDTGYCCSWPISPLTPQIWALFFSSIPLTTKRALAIPAILPQSRPWQNKLEDSCYPTNNLFLRVPCQSPLPPQPISGRNSVFFKRHLLTSKASKKVGAAQMQPKVWAGFHPAINNYSHLDFSILISLELQHHHL